MPLPRQEQNKQDNDLYFNNINIVQFLEINMKFYVLFLNSITTSTIVTDILDDKLNFKTNTQHLMVMI